MKVQRPLRAALVAAALLLTLPAVAAELSGIVTEVHDGDSLTLVSGRAAYRIRLNDIDAPELRQDRGEDSRARLTDLCRTKQATADLKGKDRYGRTLAVITCAGVNANAEQVRLGWAWVYVRYAPKDSPLYGLQQEARRARRGLWADAEALPPWEWRRL
jgi:endonuclease YncB( thermonuclease family)